MYGQTNCGGARREHCAAGRGTGGSEADGSLGASDDANRHAFGCRRPRTSRARPERAPGRCAEGPGPRGRAVSGARWRPGTHLSPARSGVPRLRCYAWLGQRSKCLGIRCRASECLGDGRITRDSA
jgi:hypothetical protein